MTVFEAAILGAVQGATEFLPISSSGHLVLFQQLFNIHEGALTFNVVIHLATLIAIILFFGRSLWHLTRREILLIGIGTIPAVIVGVLLKDQIEALFANDRFVGVELIITGLINFYTDRKLGRRTEAIKTDDHQGAEAEITPKKGILIGIAQAVAIVPGISRSGSTVAAGIGLGLDREQAFRFSFLLAIPALAGAGFLQLVDVLQGGLSAEVSVAAYVIGALTALVTGLLSLIVFKYVMSRAKLEIFGWYCIILGVIVSALTFL